MKQTKSECRVSPLLSIHNHCTPCLEIKQPVCRVFGLNLCHFAKMRSKHETLLLVSWEVRNLNDKTKKIRMFVPWDKKTKTAATKNWSLMDFSVLSGERNYFYLWFERKEKWNSECRQDKEKSCKDSYKKKSTRQQGPKINFSYSLCNLSILVPTTLLKKTFICPKYDHILGDKLS